MTFREWANDIETRAANLIPFQPAAGPIESRYALGYEDIKFLRDIDAAFTREPS